MTDIAASDLTRSSEQWVEDTFKWFRAIGSVFGLLLMTALVAAGFSLFARAVLIFFGVVGGPPDAEPQAFAEVEALRGLEYLFLAPLGYLVFLTLVRIVKRIVQNQHDPLEGYRIVKSLVVNLMIAIVATDLVRRIVGQSGLTLSVAVTELLVMASFVGYVVVLEHQRPN